MLSRMAGMWYTWIMGAWRHWSVRFAAWVGGCPIVIWIVLLALLLRLARLSFQPLWWDEGWSLYFATSDPGAMLQLTAVDIHPPFYYLLLHLWIRLFGSSLIAVRLLSVLIGVAAVPLIYLAGRRLFGHKAGLLAALLLAISPFHIYYSQEVRMYGLVTLLGLVILDSGFRILDSGSVRARLWAWVGYVLAATAALYTQYYAAFLILALNLVVLLRWLRARHPFKELLSWLAAQVAVAVLYLPWLCYAGDKLLTYVRYKVVADQDLPLDPLTYLARHLAAFAAGHAEGGLAGLWWLGLIPLLALALALLVFLRKRPHTREKSAIDGSQRAGWGLCLAAVALILTCGYLVNLVFPFNPPRSERLLLLALPAYLLLFAAALLVLWRRRWLLAFVPAFTLVAVTILSLGFFYTVARYPDDDYRPVAARLRALAVPEDAVVCVHPWQVGYFESYLPSPRPALVLTPREVIPHERQLWADDPTLMAADLQRLLAGRVRLWLPAHQAMGRVLEEQIAAYLVEHAYPTLTEWYGEHALLFLFVAGDPQPVPVTAHFGDWLALDGAALSSAPLPAGSGILAADLTWRLLSPPPADAGDLTVGLRLVDAAGRVWAQRDSLPLVGSAPFSKWVIGESRVDHHGLLVPAGTPPGDYDVTLRVYHQPDSVLPATFAGGSGGEVALGAVQVIRSLTPPPIEALAFNRPLQATFGQLRLLGFTLHGGPAFRTGETVNVDLFWQALTAPGEDYLPRLQLVDAAGTVYAELTEKPVVGAYPTAWWQAGELVRDPHALPIPAATPAGHYRVALSLVRSAGGSSVEAGRGGTSIDLAEIKVQSREHRYQPPAPGHVQVVQLGPAVGLAGYDLPETPYAPGLPLEVTLYWHAWQTPDRDYRAFVHLLDANGQIVAQHDGTPGEGELPALGWLPGEYLADTHRLALPSDLPSGEYRLEVGLYDPVTRQRLGAPVSLTAPVIVNDATPIAPVSWWPVPNASQKRRSPQPH